MFDIKRKLLPKFNINKVASSIRFCILMQYCHKRVWLLSSDLRAALLCSSLRVAFQNLNDSNSSFCCCLLFPSFINIL